MFVQQVSIQVYMSPSSVGFLTLPPWFDWFHMGQALEVFVLFPLYAK